MTCGRLRESERMNDMTTLYYVGPKSEDFPKHAWMITGVEKVASDYATELDGKVFVRELPTPRVRY